MIDTASTVTDASGTLALAAGLAGGLVTFGLWKMYWAMRLVEAGAQANVKVGIGWAVVGMAVSYLVAHLYALPMAALGIVAFFIAIVASFAAVDVEQKLIPKGVWLWGTLLALGIAAIPGEGRWIALSDSAIGALVGGGVIFVMVELGKLLFGKMEILFDKPERYRIILGESGWSIESGGERVSLAEVCMRKRDEILITENGGQVVGVTETTLRMGGQTETLRAHEGEAVKMIVPREAMGFGDVKFMIMAGAMVGWEGALFSIFVGACLGTLIGVGQRLLKGTLEIPFVPYLAAGFYSFLIFRDEVLAYFIAAFSLH